MIFKSILRDMKNKFFLYATYDFFIKLFYITILIPSVTFYFSRMINEFSTILFLNQDAFYEFFFESAKGIIIITPAVLFGIGLLLVEIGGMYALNNAFQLNKKIGLIGALRSGLRFARRLIWRPSTVLIVILLGLGAPFFPVPQTDTITGNLNVPNYISNFIYFTDEFWFQYLTFFVPLQIFYFFSIFTMQIAYVERRNLLSSFILSVGMVFQNFKEVFFRYITFFFLSFFIFNVSMREFSAFFNFIVEKTYLEGLISNETRRAFFYTSQFFLRAFLQIIILQFFTSGTTRYYYKFLSLRKAKGLRREFPIYAKFKLPRMIRPFFNILIIALVIVSGLIFNSQTKSGIDNTHRVKIGAHRGDSDDSPENTLSAIKQGVENGADYAEIDIQETKDGILVLQHDQRLGRTTNVDEIGYTSYSTIISKITYDETKDLDAGSWFDERFENERIVTLEEVLMYSKGKIKLNIEFKANRNQTKKYLENIFNLIHKYHMEDDVVVTTLSLDRLTEANRLAGDIKIGGIFAYGLGEYSKLPVDIYVIEQSNKIDADLVNYIQDDLKREVWVWTVNRNEEIRYYTYLGVDVILTNRTKRAVHILEAEKAQDAAILPGDINITKEEEEE